MKIICLIKFVPDIENFVYDYEKNILVRENVRMILNPDDASVLSFALKLKERDPEIVIEAVTMAPLSIIPHLEDILRINVDRAVLISDRLYAGSDTYVTSRILGRYLSACDYDCILTGTHAIDGDTSHVPAQIAEILKLPIMANVTEIDENTLQEKSAEIEVEEETVYSKYRIVLPAVIGLQSNRKYKLPYISYDDLNKPVRDRIRVVDNTELKFEPEEIGITGSPTQISDTFVKKLDKKERLVVENDEQGLRTVYSFLKEKGIV